MRIDSPGLTTDLDLLVEAARVAEVATAFSIGIGVGLAGGLGAYATQYALAGGAIPICVVSSEHKAELCRSMGAELIINRAAEGYQFWKDEKTQDPKEWKRFGARIRELTGGEDVDIVFEHPGRETFGASVYVTRRGGTIVTCASTSGFMHEYDNRYLWMNLKRIVGSHFANYREAWQANRLISDFVARKTRERVNDPASGMRPDDATSTPSKHGPRSPLNYRAAARRPIFMTSSGGLVRSESMNVTYSACGMNPGCRLSSVSGSTSRGARSSIPFPASPRT